MVVLFTLVFITFIAGVLWIKFSWREFWGSCSVQSNFQNSSYTWYLNNDNRLETEITGGGYFLSYQYLLTCFNCLIVYTFTIKKDVIQLSTSSNAAKKHDRIHHEIRHINTN